MTFYGENDIQQEDRLMKRKRFSPEQIIKILKKAELGSRVQ